LAKSGKEWRGVIFATKRIREKRRRGNNFATKRIRENNVDLLSRK